MITAISAIIGFAGSLIPKLLEMRQDTKDKKHELELLKLQMESQERIEGIKLEAVGVNADADAMQSLYENSKVQVTGVKFVDGLLALSNGMIRPLVTAFLVAAYINNRYLSGVMFTDFDQALLAGVLGFWFGNRSIIQRRFGNGR